MTEPRYDRQTASRVLADLAAPGLFEGEAPVVPRRIEYSTTAVVPEDGARLTLSQRLYLEQFMKPCTPDAVTSATRRITWTDSSGVPCVGHHGPSAFGAVVPVAVRETTLVLWQQLAANDALTARAAALPADDLAVLAGTTTDHEPVEVFRIGVEATGRALAQHSLIAPGGTPAEFARAMLRGGVFQAVATRWYWELQASTFRRGMIPVSLVPHADGSLRYPAATLELLRAMKDATISDAREVMRRATVDEGLTVADAVERYHDELDLISRQYALLPPGEQPRCLAQHTHVQDGNRINVLTSVAEHFVETFARVVEMVDVVEVPATPDATGEQDGDAAQAFHVPDMNCRHCQMTIGKVLDSMGIRGHEVDLATKRVSAEFRSVRNRASAMEAVRNAGYTVVDGVPER